MGDDSTKRPHRRANRAAEQVARLDLALECLKVKQTGATYEEVANRVPGVSNKGQAWKLVQQAIAEHATALAEPAEEVRAMELRRLDAMLAGLYDAATGGDTAAVCTVLKCMDRRAKYLGLDAPTKSIVEGDALGLAGVFAALEKKSKEPEPEPA